MNISLPARRKIREALGCSSRTPLAFITRAVGAVGNLLISLVVLRFEAPATTGVFLLFYTVFQIGIVLVRYGADIYIVREYYKLDEARRTELFENAVVMSLVAGTCAAPILAAVGQLFLVNWSSNLPGGVNYSLMLLMFAWLPIFGSASLVYYVYQARHQILTHIFGLNVIQPWTFLLFYVLGRIAIQGSAQMGPSLLSGAFGLSVLAFALTSYLLMKRLGLAPPQAREQGWGTALVFLRERSKFAAGSIGIQLVAWSPYLVSSFLLGAKFAAVLNLAQRFAMLMSFVSISINAAAAPKFAELNVDGRYADIYRILVRNSRRLSAVASVFALFGIVAVQAYEPFREYAMAFSVILLGYWFNCATSASGYYFQAVGSLRVLTYTLLAVAACSPILTYALAQKFELMGAAFGTMLSVMGVNMLLFPYAMLDLSKRNAVRGDSA